MTNETTKAIESTINGETLRLVFGGNENEAITITRSMLTNDIIIQATMHGLKQKLVDAAAISRNPDTGRSATIADKFNAVMEVYDRLCAGQWNKVRDGAGAVSGGLLFRALCIAYPAKAPEVLREYLGKRTAEEKTALRAKFADIIATLKAPSTDLDTDAMLDELND
jgi:hypothetical protein